MVSQSQRSHSMLNPWVSPDFCLFSFFEDEKLQEDFLWFCHNIKKIWQKQKLACDKTTKLITVCMHKIKYPTAIHITCGNWRCILIRGVNAFFFILMMFIDFQFYIQFYYTLLSLTTLLHSLTLTYAYTNTSSSSFFT